MGWHVATKFRARGPDVPDIHQAETARGWRIRRDGELLTTQPGARAINATLFIAALGRILDDYRDSLKAANWDSEMWECLRTKMKRVCANCSTAATASS